MKFQGFDENDVVISGIGCKLPETDNLEEFTEKLFQGINLVTKDDPKLTKIFQENVPSFSGKVKHKNFDNLFFSISNVVSLDMDPMNKQILERTVEALVDAGLNPADLKDTDASVYSGTSYSDFDLLWQAGDPSGYSIMGKNRCMIANRTSWCLDLKGTSVSMDGSWCNGMLNLIRGCEAIRKGRCDTAIISTGNLIGLPENNVQFDNFRKFNPDGACKPYDDCADGWCRSEAIVVFVLQRASIAKRCYCIIDDTFLKFYGDVPTILQEPTQLNWERMLQEFYAQSKINVNDLCYVEGSATGIKEHDANEVNAITSVLCKNRTTPLLIGSVQSNIGYTEPSSSLCSVLKAIISFEKGVIPKTLHYTTPNKKCPGLITEKIKVVDKNTPMPPNGLIAVNAQGMANLYGHAVLRPNPKTEKREYDGIPRLVLLSARTDDVMDELLDKIENSPIDVEQIGLLHDVFTQKVNRYLSRGYTIVPNPEESVREHQVFDPIERPVWFIFSGMGSQWCKMGKRLMDLPIFRASIEKSHEVLKSKGLNLIDIVTTDDPKVFDNILHSFVGIAAIQIALVDILNALGIVPDKIIGHSVGELGCSYADGCLTAEQTILCAYSRGKASIETPLIKGFMAAVGKGYNEIKDELPEGIEVACHNASDSCTISGPAELVQNYVKELQERNVFARTVNVSNIAYHSQYITPAAPKLLEYLQEVIPEPKLRSKKWISTSILEGNWNSDLAKYCSAEYHTNNLLSSVYFEEASRHIPSKAICIEIAPHGLLQAILKRSLQKGCIHIPLTNRTAKDPLYFFLQGIGKMYMAGLEPKIKNIYPKIEYPVSRGTGSLSHFVRWQHNQSDTRYHAFYIKNIKYFLKDQFSKTSKDDTGYVINGKNYYPLSVFLDLTWGAFAASKKMKKLECPVLFENVQIQKHLVIQDSETHSAYISIGLATGKFEIYTDEVIISGTVSLTDKKPKEAKLPKLNGLDLRNKIYADFKRRGCNIGVDLRCLESVECDNDVWKSQISHSCDWLQTIEALIQLAMLERGRDSLSTPLPYAVEKLSIIPDFHLQHKNSVKESEYMQVEFNSTVSIVRCGGIEMKGLKLQEITEKVSDLKFESLKFVPCKNSLLGDLWEMIDYCYGIISDNFKASDITVSQFTNEKGLSQIADYLEKKFSPSKVSFVKETVDTDAQQKSNLVVCDAQSFHKALQFVDERGFILVKFSENLNTLRAFSDELATINTFSTNEDGFALFRKKQILNDTVDYITIPNNEILFNKIIKGLEKSKKTTYLIDYKEPEEGFENFKKNVQGKTTSPLRWLLILDEKAPKFDPKNPFYADQLQKGLATNVYYNGSWGSFYRKTYSVENCDIEYSLRTKVEELSVSHVGLDLEDNLVPKQQVEYSGTLNDKTRVAGIAEIQKDKKLLIDKYLQWKLPAHWSLEDGATVPTAYALAYYCMRIVACSLKRGNANVLVTDGLSCSGRAAIAIALSYRFRVFVTVNKDEEIPIVQNLFPALNKEDIISHEYNDFDIPLRYLTDGTYFEIVMNNVEEEKLYPALRCLAVFGVMFHFGREDLKKNVQLGTISFLNYGAFYGVSPDVLSRLTTTEKALIRHLVAWGIENEHIKPLPRVTYAAKDLEKIKHGKEISPNNTKVLFTNDNFELDSGRLRIGAENSYIIIGDETDYWMDIAECLIAKDIINVIVSTTETSSVASDRMQNITNLQKISVTKEKDISILLNSARKLAPISAIFVIRMHEYNNVKQLIELDKLYEDKSGHLIVLSRKEDRASQICSERMSKGYRSTNFIWKTEERITKAHLTMLEKLSGQDPVIQVSDNKRTLNRPRNSTSLLADVLPSSIEDFCELGSSLNESVRLVEIPSLGQRVSEIKEITPIFVIPGLNDYSESSLRRLAKKLVYPVFMVKLPSIRNEITIKELASLVLPKIHSVNNSGKVYNILGVSWGSYVAIELTRILEELGANVSLMLINGPLKEMKEILVAKKSLESDLINILQGISNHVASETTLQGPFPSQVDQILARLEIPQQDVKHVKAAITYIYQNLKAMLNYDYSKTTLKGPITIFKSEELYGDISIKKICDNVSIRNVTLDYKEDLDSKKLANPINGSAISPLMEEHFINECSWKEFDEFLINDKREAIENDIFIEELQKTGRAVYFK